METVHLDTHVAIWLYVGEGRLLPSRARSLMEGNQLLISPAVLLEIQFLRESGRVSFKVDRFLRDMSVELGVGLAVTPFADVALEAVRISWTRDPFDRLIVAQAVADEATLVTRDRMILKHCRQAVWD